MPAKIIKCFYLFLFLFCLSFSSLFAQSTYIGANYFVGNSQNIGIIETVNYDLGNLIMPYSGFELSYLWIQNRLMSYDFAIGMANTGTSNLQQITSGLTTLNLRALPGITILEVLEEHYLNFLLGVQLEITLFNLSNEFDFPDLKNNAVSYTFMSGLMYRWDLKPFGNLVVKAMFDYNLANSIQFGANSQLWRYHFDIGILFPLG